MELKLFAENKLDPHISEVVRCQVIKLQTFLWKIIQAHDLDTPPYVAASLLEWKCSVHQGQVKILLSIKLVSIPWSTYPFPLIPLFGSFPVAVRMHQTRALQALRVKQHRAIKAGFVRGHDLGAHTPPRE